MSHARETLSLDSKGGTFLISLNSDDRRRWHVSVGEQARPRATRPSPISTLSLHMHLAGSRVRAFPPSSTSRSSP